MEPTDSNWQLVRQIVALGICAEAARLVAKEFAPLRVAMEDIHARASAVLNNGFPDEAPEALAGIAKAACDALKP